MPHIIIKTYPDVSEEQKQKLTQAITEQVMHITGKPETFISIAIVEVTEENWMKDVYEKDIKPKLDGLYKKPGY